MSKTKGVTGIGGIFFKTADVNGLKSWYSKHLGINMDEYGASFVTRQFNDPDKSSYLQWSPFKKDTEYFDPSENEFMINYRVRDIEGMVKDLKSAGVTICDEIASYEYGKFVHILDHEGRKIELWEPIDHVFDKYYDDPDRKVNT